MNFKRLCVGILLLMSSTSLMAREIDQVIQALAPYVSAAKRPYYELRATSWDQDFLKADVAWTRNDGAIYEAILTINEGALQAVETRVVSPSVDATTSSSLEPVLQTLTAGPLVVTGFVQESGGRALVAYEQVTAGYEAPERFLAEVMGSGDQKKVRPYQPKPQDKQILRDLALAMARFQAFALATRYDAMTAAARERGEEFPGPHGPVARLEVELRLARVTSLALQKQSAEDSAVGFDPGREWIQYMLPAVLSDNAIFVTFGKDGRYRLEDFN